MAGAAHQGLSPNRVIVYTTRMIEPDMEPVPQFWNRVGELNAAATCLLYLAGAASDRFTITQGAFFMLAARADAAGKPATRSSLIAAYQEQFRGSIRNSYRQLLEPCRRYPDALGWLTTTANPIDDRERLLRLTKRGAVVAARALLALDPDGLEDVA